MKKNLTIKVEDIGCTGCACDIETVLLGTDGILSVGVAYAEDRIRVTYDPEVLDEEQILAVIGKMCLRPMKA